MKSLLMNSIEHRLLTSTKVMEEQDTQTNLINNNHMTTGLRVRDWCLSLLPDVCIPAFKKFFDLITHGPIREPYLLIMSNVL